MCSAFFIQNTLNSNGLPSLYDFLLTLSFLEGVILKKLIVLHSHDPWSMLQAPGLPLTDLESLWTHVDCLTPSQFNLGFRSLDLAIYFPNVVTRMRRYARPWFRVIALSGKRGAGRFPLRYFRFCCSKITWANKMAFKGRVIIILSHSRRRFESTQNPIRATDIPPRNNHRLLRYPKRQSGLFCSNCTVLRKF